MEILRSTYSTEIREQAGNPQIPDLIKLLSHPQNPGRAIGATLEELKLGDFQTELKSIKKTGKKEKSDMVGVYYINGADLYLGNEGNYFSSDENRNTISVRIDEPKINPNNPRKYLPKEKSVGAVVHYSQSSTLPMPDNLLHLLLEDKNFKAATAAFFLTKNDDVHAIFRGDQTPQADTHRAKRIVENMKAVQKDFYYTHSHNGVDMKTANMCVLREAIHEYDLKYFHGNLISGNLKRSSPELHPT